MLRDESDKVNILTFIPDIFDAFGCYVSFAAARSGLQLAKTFQFKPGLALA